MDSHLTKDALELLKTLDNEQRTDLSVHLYSTHLLKHLLKNANKAENKILPTETFLKSSLGRNWTSWPSQNTVIDPNTTSIYEDNPSSHCSSDNLRPGQLDEHSMNHASDMLFSELNAVWQKCLTDISSDSSLTLDINSMDLPEDIFQSILFKLDHFIGSLHLNVAEKNHLDISTTPADPRVRLTTEELKSINAIKIKNKPQFDYKDLIVHGCDMGEDMSHVYLKAVELFQDIPKSLDSSQFELPDEFLNKFAHIKMSNTEHASSASEESDEDNEQNILASKKSKMADQSADDDRNEKYVLMDQIIKNRSIDPRVRKEIRLLLRKDEFARDKKMFLTVLNHNKEIEEEGMYSDYGLDDLI